MNGRKDAHAYRRVRSNQLLRLCSTLGSAEFAILLTPLVGTGVNRMSGVPAPSSSIGISSRNGDAKIAAMTTDMRG